MDSKPLPLPPVILNVLYISRDNEQVIDIQTNPTDICSFEDLRSLLKMDEKCKFYKTKRGNEKEDKEKGDKGKITDKEDSREKIANKEVIGTAIKPLHSFIIENEGIKDILKGAPILPLDGSILQSPLLMKDKEYPTREEAINAAIHESGAIIIKLGAKIYYDKTSEPYLHSPGDPKIFSLIFKRKSPYMALKVSDIKESSYVAIEDHYRGHDFKGKIEPPHIHATQVYDGDHKNWEIYGNRLGRGHYYYKEFTKNKDFDSDGEDEMRFERTKICNEAAKNKKEEKKGEKKGTK
jgi:hypothetical protein